MKPLKPLIKFAIFFSLILSLFAFSNKSSDDKNYHTKLQIINQSSGAINDFLVKIAKTDDERLRGLMWIKELPLNNGMIFEFSTSQIIQMWMKNTKIPLDMIFIDKNNKIISITRQTKPESLEIISSQIPASKVLEINGGLVDKLNIKVGDLVKYRNGITQNNL